MAKTMTADQLRRRALELGAEAVIEGRPFNTARMRVEPAAPAPAVPAVPAGSPAKEPDIDKLLKEHADSLRADLQSEFMALLATMSAAQKPPPGYFATGFDVSYNDDGSIKFVGVKWSRLQ